MSGANPFAALVRGEDEQLHVRRFASAKEANAHNAARDIEQPPSAQDGPPRSRWEGANDALQMVTGSLPAILAHLAANDGDRIVIRPRADGGVEVDVVRRNKLYVSAEEFCELLPLFSDRSDPKRLLDQLVKLGMPYADPTGSKIFNVSRCERWIRSKFGRSGDQHS